jgi:hypothetical protein
MIDSVESFEEDCITYKPINVTKPKQVPVIELKENSKVGYRCKERRLQSEKYKG